MQHLKKIGLSLLTGILLSAAWPSIGGVLPLIFIAFLPLLWLQNRAHEQGYSLSFLHPYLAFFVFNILCTGWLFNVEEALATKLFSALMPSLLNALLMAMVWFSAFALTRGKEWNSRVWSFAFAFLAFEYLHLDWDLSWPWLQLGNAFAENTSMIQFYEYTGVLGGSLWVLMANIVAFGTIRRLKQNQDKVVKSFIVMSSLFVVLLPYLWSLSLFSQAKTEHSRGEKLKVSLVQPNVDPYHEKFNHSANTQRLLESIDLCQAELKKTGSQLIVFPETALQEQTYISSYGGTVKPIGLWENSISDSYSYKVLMSNLVKPYGVDLLVGMSSDSLLPEGPTARFEARYMPQVNRHYVSFNSALYLSGSKENIYHKSKLVPGVEQTPFSSVFKHLKGLAMDLGGTSGGLGTQKERSVFSSEQKPYLVAPIICYESVYGSYVGDYVKNGAQFLAIITNDAWWGVSAGHRQHLAYARLRAIEHRRWVARSANTGISAFINPLGQIVQRTNFREKNIISGEITLEDELTFYSRQGDYVGRLSLFFVLLFFLYSFVKKRTGKA